MAGKSPVTMDTLIAVKVQFQNTTRKFTVSLRDLGPQVFPVKLRTALNVPADEQVIFERYSDNAGAYVVLDANNSRVYKTLLRAAKAKLKLRLRARLVENESETASSPEAAVSLQNPVAAASQDPVDAVSLQHPVDSISPPPHMIAETQSPQIPMHNPPDNALPALPDNLLSGDDGAQLNSAAGPASPAPVTAVKYETRAEVLARVLLNHQVSPVLDGGPPAISQYVKQFLRERKMKHQLAQSVFCNNCHVRMENEHYHCGTCDNGDYDLCAACVDSGLHCRDAEHWMVKRFIENGSFVHSITERVSPRLPSQPVPGAFTEEKQAVVEPASEPGEDEPVRTCNCCVRVLHESEFLTCVVCDDYDLCHACHVSNKHGHHPGHQLKPVSEKTALSPADAFLCNAGRNVRHFAVCDGCDKFIYGVRHKCLHCPDWDFCTECIKSSKRTHPGHVFVPIYEPLAESRRFRVRHYGIFCDGPLCKIKDDQTYIQGVRFKCAVCHDIDFCANCEAHPSNTHNYTHPLIKFNRAVRSVSVTTVNEDKDGRVVTRVGDRSTKCSPPTSPGLPSCNASTQVQTVADVSPSEDSRPDRPEEVVEALQAIPEPLKAKVCIEHNAAVTSTEPGLPRPCQGVQTKQTDALDAHFVRDTVIDGSQIVAGLPFVQVWSLRNPGPNTWPAGCSVNYVGGDSMLNIDNTQPLSQSELSRASESNVADHPVQPGEEIAFRVLLKAPQRVGTAISYWRLKTADGLPFGHRLWCDIEVVSPLLPTSSLDRVCGKDAAIRNCSQNVNPQIVSLEERRRSMKEEFTKLPLEQARKQEMEDHYQQKTAESLGAAAAGKDAENQQIGEAPAESESQSYRMIIPQLEKESPAGSAHEAMTAPSEVPPTIISADQRSEHDFFEDAESVELDSLKSEDGFQTDDEYDILDASDEERL